MSTTIEQTTMLSTTAIIDAPTAELLPDQQPATQIMSPEVALAPSRFRDYSMVLKPRLTFMAMVSVAVGFAFGYRGDWSSLLLFHTLVGVGLAAFASSALNQFWERDSDQLMARTANRPLPAGRLAAGEIFTFGMVCTFASVIYLSFFVNPLTAMLALGTIVLYVAVYTPLKRVSSLCTIVGAIAGAAPPVLGWTGSGQPLNAGAFALFAILFLWQFPHFLAIAWLYRDQYQNAKLKMLPMASPQKGVTGTLAVGYALILLPVSLLPHQFQMAGIDYFAAAFAFSLVYLAFSVQFMLFESRKTARQLLYCSFFYLPTVLLVLTWSHFQTFSF